MKKILIYCGLSLLFTAMFTACKDNPSIPSESDVTTPTVTIKPNMTIAKFLSTYFTSSMAPDTIKDDVIIAGTVISDHWYKNFYGNFYVQDSTSGIQIRMGSPMYATGQKVVIKCQGFILGQYGGMAQLGALYNGSVGYLSTVVAKECILESGNPSDVAPTTITYAQRAAYVGRLVRFDNVTFSTGGKTWDATTLSGGSYNNIFTDASRNAITTRTDQNAAFKSQMIPKGTGSVVGVLSIYGSTYQLNIRNMNDLINFH
jgi:hypothetical protein